MRRIRKLQKLLEHFAAVDYKGCYLWKYLQYELLCGIAPNAQMSGKNVVLQRGFSDCIPKASIEQISEVEGILERLSEKDILFGMIPLRRKYYGKYVHTAMDAYVSSIEEDWYTVIEPISGRKEDEEGQVITKNRVRYSTLGVIGYYGQEMVDTNDLLLFLLTEYIHPIEEAFQIEFPRQLLVLCACKASMVLKERNAFLSFFSEVIKRVKPKVICYTHGPDVIMCFLYEAAQKLAVPTVEVEHGAIIRNLSYPAALAYSDYYLTQSDLLTKPMIKCGMQNVYTVGKPGIYHNVRMQPREKEPIVVSFISSMEPDLYMQARQLAKRLASRNYQVVYKLHAIEQCSEEERAQIVSEHKNWKYLEGAVDVRDMFACSDIVVGVRSTGILDALPFCEIKIITLKEERGQEPLDGNQDFFHELERVGDIVCVEDGEQLYEEIICYEKGRNYRNAVNHYWPVNSDSSFREYMKSFCRKDGRR